MEEIELAPFEKDFIALIDAICSSCYEASRSKGFWSDHDEVLNILRAVSNQDLKERLLKAADNAFMSQKRDLMHSEMGEQTEAARKDLPSDKLPGFTGEEEEMADLFIRGFDYAKRKKLRLGLAIVLKMRYNAGREYMHGKAF